MNVILTNLDINVAINIFDSSMDVIHGDQGNAGKIVNHLYSFHVDASSFYALIWIVI